MKTEVVGPFEIKALNVDEGLDLMTLSTEGNTNAFQKELIFRTVYKDGNPIQRDADFAELVPYFAEIVKAALTLNGFGSKSE